LRLYERNKIISIENFDGEIEENELLLPKELVT
jgi:hypothetical protein